MNASKILTNQASIASTLLSASLLLCAGPAFAANSPTLASADKPSSTTTEAVKSSDAAEANKVGASQEGEDNHKLASKDKSDKDKGDKDKNEKDKSKEGVPVEATSAKKKQASETAGVVNQVPGVNVKKEDLEPPSLPPIHGFHPIKKLLRPVENLEGMSIKLEQQIMKLEGPIAALQPPMQSLQKQMVTVDSQINTMHSQLDSMQSQVQGVRSDLAGMKQEIKELKAPIVSLEKPIAGVATPLEDLNKKLNYILGAIVLAAIAIALGTPLAAIVVYRNRKTFFPGMSDHEMPKVIDGKEKEPADAGAKK